jgi:predicted nucleic acid-binding protein
MRRLAPTGRIDSILKGFRTRSIRVDGALLKDQTLNDEGDRRLVEAAVEGNAAYVVTADQEMLQYRGYSGTEFVTPVELLKLLAS